MAEQTYMKIAGIDGMPTIGGASINAWTLPPAVNRYEKTIFSSTNGNGVSAGNVTEPFSAFDEIGIGLGYVSDRDTWGKNYIWLSNSVFQAATGQVQLVHDIGSKFYHLFYMNTLKYDNTGKTFSTVNDVSTCYGAFYTDYRNNGKLSAQNNVNKINCVTDIIGVKYQ